MCIVFVFDLVPYPTHTFTSKDKDVRISEYYDEKM